MSAPLIRLTADAARHLLPQGEKEAARRPRFASFETRSCGPLLRMREFVHRDLLMLRSRRRRRLEARSSSSAHSRGSLIPVVHGKALAPRFRGDEREMFQRHLIHHPGKLLRSRGAMRPRFEPLAPREKARGGGAPEGATTYVRVRRRRRHCWRSPSGAPPRRFRTLGPRSRGRFLVRRLLRASPAIAVVALQSVREAETASVSRLPAGRS